MYGRAVKVHHGKRSDLDSHRIDHQRIAFVMADGIPIPGRRHLRRMRLVHAHIADLMIVDVEEE